MDDIIEVEDSVEQISLARCRELLGDESTELSDAELNAIREHAQALATSWSNCSSWEIPKAEPQV